VNVARQASATDQRLIVQRVAMVVAVLAVPASAWFLDPRYVVAALAVALSLAAVLIYPVAGPVLLAFAVPWTSGFSATIGGFPLTYTDAVIGVLVAAWLVRWNIHRLPLFSTFLWIPYLLAFLAAIALSATQASDQHAALRELVKWVEVAGVYVATAAAVRTRRDLALVLTALLVAGVSQAILGFVQVVTDQGPAAFQHGLVLRAYGSFDQPNPYAGFLNMMLAPAVALALFARRPDVRWASGAGAALMLTAIFLSQSRGAFLATVVGMSCLIAIGSARGQRWTLGGVFAAIGVAWGSPYGLVSQGPVDRVLSAMGLSGVSFGNVTDANFSAVERAAHWLTGVREFSLHPFLGVGIGNYASAYPALHPRGWYDPLSHAHNYYINIAAEAGILGLTTYLFVTASAVWYSYVLARRAEQDLCRCAALGVLGALATTDFHNLFDVLYVHGMAGMIGLLMGLVPAAAALEVFNRCGSLKEPAVQVS